MPWKAKILVVEDDRATGLLYSNLLRDRYTVTLVTNGSDALKHLHANRPDLIILDQVLPDMEGMEIGRHVRADQRFQGTKVVMISGVSNTDQRVAAYRAGVDDFLGKPVDTAELLERIETDLAMRRSRRAEVDDGKPAGTEKNARPNCWEFMQCGRDKTGDCPAFTQQVGRYCWLVAGTMCGGTPQGTYAPKMLTCMECRFYQSIRTQK